MFNVSETPTCSITSKEDTDVLVQYQDLALTVDVRDYYCSTANNVSLQTGDVTTLLMEADSVPNVSDNTSSVTLNVTDSHLAPRTPTCDITSDKDTETLTLQEEVTLTVNITAYYDIRGSYCSAESNFTLQTGDVKQILNVGDQGLQPVTFNVTKTHLGGVRLVFNCQDDHRNLSCDGVTELNNKMKARDEVATSSIPIIITAVVVSLVSIVIIVFVVKRKVNRIKQRSSVKSCSPPCITVG
ncbi:uncharacterized protein LOC124254803 isoform X2 [Haliotis rubra]|uniref:uncharacterized protein LOC124254803 isoform X2 n=1 Tax=Haliotis rubra TaxID=36100 RepID=UPI001EE5656F|nr:uncharacterized protein LOC124254803 isoform X2 [Haliotis rubra]